MKQRVDQFHTLLSRGNAISAHVLQIQDLLRALGYESDIFCEQAPIQFARQVHLVADYESIASENDILLIHFAMGLAPQTFSWLKQLRSRRILIYHNITPAHYFVGINFTFQDQAHQGRIQLGKLQAITEAAWGVSAFNAQELADHGWKQPGVLPIIFHSKHGQLKVDKSILKTYQDGPNILFFGRIAPNKRIEDLILSFYFLKRFIQPAARLILVGSVHRMAPYVKFLHELTQKLAIPDIIFAGHVNEAQWAAYYQSADVYLSMSEHEGFCLPLLESMYFEVPIIAYKAAAVSETLGGSGILVKEKNHRAIAELINLVLEDHDLRSKIIRQQRKRLQDFSSEAVKAQLKQLLAKF